MLHALEKKSNVHIVTHDDVQVKSTISCQTETKVNGGDAQSKINGLMAKLGEFSSNSSRRHFSSAGSTHLQVEEYSRRRNEEISEAVRSSIEKIVHLTRVDQEQLLDEAEKQCGLIETDYQNKLMQ